MILFIYESPDGGNTVTRRKAINSDPTDREVIQW